MGNRLVLGSIREVYHGSVCFSYPLFFYSGKTDQRKDWRASGWEYCTWFIYTTFRILGLVLLKVVWSDAIKVVHLAKEQPRWKGYSWPIILTFL